MSGNKKKTVLVTGGAGFIGANLVPKLADIYDVTVVDNLSLGIHKEHVSHYSRFIQADIRNTEEMDKIVSGKDYIIHLAAFGSVVDSVKDPSENFSINVEGTYNLLRLAAAYEIKHFVFASTGGAIIGNATPPVDESSLPSPISPYGASKLCGEAYCHGFAGSIGLNATILRFANIYGPFSQHKKGAVTAFIKSLYHGGQIDIYGDGQATRDYLYVDDLCDAIITVLCKSTDPSEIFHLACGRETSVTELVKLLSKIANKDNHEVNYFPKRAGEIERNFASYDKAKKVFGFNPKITLEDGLMLTWDWYCRNVFNGK